MGFCRCRRSGRGRNAQAAPGASAQAQQQQQAAHSDQWHPRSTEERRLREGSCHVGVLKVATESHPLAMALSCCVLHPLAPPSDESADVEQHKYTEQHVQNRKTYGH